MTWDYDYLSLLVNIEQFFVSAITEKGITSFEKLRDMALSRFNFNPYLVYGEQEAKRIKKSAPILIFI